MQKYVLLLTTSAVMLAWGTVVASAQAMTPGGPMTPQEPQTLQQQLERQLQGVQTQRPMTHDLLKNILDELGATVEGIDITELREGTFYAVIRIRSHGQAHEVSSRPSDAIALAVRAGAPIFAAEEVLEEASISMREDESEETEVEKFREFLDQVTPEDFKSQ